MSGQLTQPGQATWNPRPPTPPGWYPSPGALGFMRWWDGTRWTEHTFVPAPVRVPQRNQSTSVAPWLIAAAGLLAIVGSILPWAILRTGFGDVSVSGIDGDGAITLVLGLGLLVLGLCGLAGARQILSGVSLLPAIGVGGVALVDIGNVANVADELGTAFAQLSVGPGLWVCLVAAILATVGAVVGLASR